MRHRDTPIDPPQHLAFLVRCWQEQSGRAGTEMAVWRFSLQNMRSNQRRGFATLEALLVALETELADDEVE